MGFRGLKSWSKIRRFLMGMSETADFYFGKQELWGDLTLDLCDEPTIRSMLYHLDDSNTGLFMIIRPPNTQIPLFIGEIGTAHLYLEGKYHFNIPRVAYQTDLGEVVLFPHEIMPVTIDSLDRYIEDGTMHLAKNSKIPRYIPTAANLQAIEATFGRLVGGYMHDWENRYFELCGERVPGGVGVND